MVHKTCLRCYATGAKEAKKEYLEIIDKYLRSYPEDVFPRLTFGDLEIINNAIEKEFPFSLDRLSAHILRDFLIRLKKEIEE